MEGLLKKKTRTNLSERMSASLEAGIEKQMTKIEKGFTFLATVGSTAPLLTVGVQVDLPESSADSLPEETEPLTLSINAKGEIFIQEAKVEYDNIIAKVLAVSKNRTDTRIYVRGDKTINYGRVLELSLIHI